jgi:hypothetical protein
VGQRLALIPSPSHRAVRPEHPLRLCLHIDLVGELREWDTTYQKNKEADFSNEASFVSKDQTELQKHWAAANSKSIQASIDHDNEYKKFYWARMLAVYNALTDRLKQEKKDIPQVPGFTPSGVAFATLSQGCAGSA